MTVIWCMVPEIWSAINRQNFLSFWTIFCPFTLLTTQKIKSLKNWKKRQEILSFYTCVPQMIIIWCIVPEIWSVKDKIFCNFGRFFAFLLPNNPKNQNFGKMKKKTGDFTHVYHKWQSYDYGSWDMKHDRQNFLSFWTVFCLFTP